MNNCFQCGKDRAFVGGFMAHSLDPKGDKFFCDELCFYEYAHIKYGVKEECESEKELCVSP